MPTRDELPVVWLERQAHGLAAGYGENDTMLFGLLTGSYGKPHDGGVLRKAVDIHAETRSISTTGQFYLLTPPGIINTIDRCASRASRQAGD